MKIGVFDSGLGGRVILDAIRERLPKYDYLYYGDTANLPYGDKPEEVIRSLTRTAVLELFARDAALVIVACNTASAESLRALQDELIKGEYQERRILGVIIPTIEELTLRGVRKTLLIGTRRTVESGKYARELAKCECRDITLTAVPTPELVPLIESGALTDAFLALQKYLTPRIGEIDTLILGCTHYGLLKERLRETYPHLTVIAQEEIVPEKLETYLERHADLTHMLTQNGTCEYIITGDIKSSNPSRRE